MHFTTLPFGIFALLTLSAPFSTAIPTHKDAGVLNREDPALQKRQVPDYLSSPSRPALTLAPAKIRRHPNGSAARLPPRHALAPRSPRPHLKPPVRHLIRKTACFPSTSSRPLMLPPRPLSRTNRTQTQTSRNDPSTSSTATAPTIARNTTSSSFGPRPASAGPSRRRGNRQRTRCS
jgi:hypothetical protein